MPKFINKDQLDKLAKSLDNRSKAVVSEEEQRAQAAEQSLLTQIETTRDMFGGKSIVYITQAEYDSLSEEEQNDNTKAYFITDAEDLTHKHNNKDLLDNFGARNITIGNSSKTFDGSKNISYTLADIGAAESGHTHDNRYYTESEVNTKLSDLQTEVNADIKAEENRAKAAETSLQTAIDGKADISHGNHVPETQIANNAIFLRCDNTWATVTPDNIGAAAKSHGTHVTYSTTVPKANGTAAVGSEASVARGDHVHPAQTSVSGNAGTATALQNARTITIGNQSNSFDGTENISYTVTDIGAAPASHNHDGRYYTEAEVDVKIGNLQSEIDSDVKVETDRAMEVEAELQAAIDGKANASHNHNDLYYTESEMNTKLAAKADTGHDHDDDYYTQTEIDGKIETINTAINGKANASHGNHVPTTETANNARFLRNDNTWATITPGNIGAAAKSHGTHVTWSTTVPLANGEASVGSETKVARGDHIHPLQESVEKLTTARTITIGNQGIDFDGSANIDFTLGDIGAAAAGHNHDERYYTEAEINTKMTNLQAEIDADVKVETDRAKEAEAALEAAIGSKAASGHTHDDRYFTETEVTNKLATKSDIGHDHDDDYYTETEIDGKIETLETAIDGKANVSHGNHVPATQTADNKVFLRNDNTWATITPANIGAANSSHGTHVTWATNAPKAPAATAAVGSVNRVAREDHVHPVQTDVTGNAGTATKLAEAKSITIGNASQSFDGSANISYTLADIGAAASGHNHDSRYYTETEINTKITELQAEIDADVKEEADRAMEVEAELQAAIDGKAENGHNHDSRYFTETEITQKLAGKSDTSHNHDERYYTETEIDGKITSINTAISGKADKAHGNHVPTTQTASNKVFLRNDNTWATITPANIGAAAESHGTHVTYATATPKANGTAAVGTSSKVAREDHVHPLQETITGNAGSADVLSAARTITIGEKGLEFDGSENLTYTLAEIGAAAASHSHDGRYYTESEINTKVTNLQAEIDADVKEEADRAKEVEQSLQSAIDGKANVNHGNHVPATQTANNKVFLRNDNTWATVTPANIGAAASSHTHDDRYFTETEINSKITTINTAISNAQTAAQNYADTKIAALVDSAPDALNTLNELATAITDHKDVYDAYVEEIDAKLAGKSDTSHTHNYAGSSSAGGAATSANKVNSNLVVKLNSGSTEGTNLFTFNGSAAKTINITPDNIGAAKSSHGTHVTWATNAPSANGTAAVGSVARVAREDHVHPLQTTVSGNAGSATKLQTARTIKIGNQSNNFNGTGNITYTAADMGLVRGDNVSATLPATAGWYRVAQTTTNMGAQVGLFIIKEKLSGYHSEAIITAGTSHGQNPTIQQLAYTCYSTKSLTKARLVYLVDNSGTNAYLEVYSSAAKAIELTVEMIGEIGWTLLTPVAGSIPTSYTSKELTFAANKIVANINGSVSGNAGSATKLATARNLTIGSTGKTFNGTADVSWTLDEIGAAAKSHTHNYAGSSSAGGAANSVANSLSIQLNGGTATTFNGSAAKSINITPSSIGAAASSHGTHVDYATATPKANGTAAVGSSTKVAREDHVHPVQTSISGAAGSAGKWTTARTITIGNTGKSVDGSENVSWTLTEIGAAAASHGNHVPATQTANNATFLRNDNTWQKITPANIGAAASSHGEHVTYSTTTPKANGTASVGSESKVARGDHVHPLQTTVSGNAGTATKLKTARTITVDGVVSGSTSFDGSQNVTITTVANDITTITKSLTVTTDWMDTGIAGSNLSTGTYAVQLYVDSEGQGGQWDEYYSGIMSWYSGGTNSGEADEIFLHKAGHATNSEGIFLRTIRQNSGDNKVLKLQIAASKAFTAEVSLQFKFKKLI